MRLHQILLIISLGLCFSNCFISRERYEEIKANVDFEVMEYDIFLNLFGNKKYEDVFKYNGANHLISEQDKEKITTQNPELYLESNTISTSGKLRSGISIPDQFDWRDYYPQCFYPPRNQGECGSCYSFSATFSLESRMCIKGRGQYLYKLSQQDVVSCDYKNKKCFGDTIVNTYEYIENYGTCSYDCKPYVSFDMSVPSCQYSCVNKSEPFIRYRALKGSFWASNSINDIKENLYSYGPLSTFMETYEDMHLFKSTGVYQHRIGKQTDYHAIVIIGWGVDKVNNKEFWILRNSWGTDWGDNGYFRVYFNDLQINDYVCGSLPMI